MPISGKSVKTVVLNSRNNKHPLLQNSALICQGFSSFKNTNSISEPAIQISDQSYLEAKIEYMIHPSISARSRTKTAERADNHPEKQKQEDESGLELPEIDGNREKVKLFKDSF